MAGELTIQQNTDGTATINFPGGGSHTVGQAGDDVASNVSALQAAYGNRIGDVIQSGMSSSTQANKNEEIRQQQRDDVLNRTQNGIGLITDTTGNGYSTQDIQNYVNSTNKYSSVEEAVSKTTADGKKILSKYFSADEIASMSTKQLLAASELNYQGNSDTGRTNGLSVQDLNFIVNEANSFSASVWSPNTQAISTGYDPVASPVITSNGVSQDTRNWSAIVASDNPVVAAQIATNQMYGGTYVDFVSGGYKFGDDGNVMRDEQGQPLREAPSLHIVGNNGAIIQKIPEGTQNISQLLQNYGIIDTSWLNNTQQHMSVDMVSSLQGYNPYAEFTNMWTNSFVSGVSASVSPFYELEETQKTISGTGTGTDTTQVGTEGTQVTGDQTQQQTDTDGVSMAANEAIVTPSQLPQTVSYQMPQNYQGSGFMPSYTGDTTTMQPSTMAPMTGTFTKPTGSGMMNYQPTQQYTMGQTTPKTPQMSQPQQAEVRMYRNDSGMTTSITFVNGQPQTPIPSGFYPVGQQPAGQTQYQPQVPQVQAPTPTSVTPYTPQFNMNQGGIVPPVPTPAGNKFGGFRPEAMQRIAQNLGYSGDMGGFDQYLTDNPDKKEKMNNYTTRAKQMAEGGMVQKFNPGGDVQSTTVDIQQYDPRVLNQQYIPQQPDFTGQDITQVQAGLAKTPGLPTGATVVPTGTQLTAGQLVSPYSGQVAGSLALPTALASTEQAMMPMTQQAALASPIEASGAVSATVDQTQAAQLQQVAAITAAQQQATSVSNLTAAQGTGILMDNPVQRQIQSGEIISAAANAETAAKFNEEIQAATATPTAQATVQGQLETLMTQFEGGNTPAWAAGSMRNATATLSARGLGASSMAGQAVIQAAMEAALPIAQMDAQVQAQFEGQNLSNRQQRAMLAAQQRAQFLGQEFDQEFQSRVANAAKVSDVANMNFTAEQQVALENSRIANTMELTNLSNSQAMVLAEASALANMDMANLNNRQQASVQNAQNFLQADLTNLSNQQQTELFKAQQRVQSLFTDQAALNAAQQFNASSENQVSQFFASLQSNTSQFNASQANAQGQFNAGQVNVIERFNAEINNQRDQFNAQNRLIIDQSNAQWRREIATADTAAVNRANEVNAQSLLGYSQQAYNNLWQYYADNMEWAWTSAENERQRYMNLTVAKMQQDTSITLAKAKEDYESSSSFGNLIGTVLTSDLSNTMLSGIFG